MCTKTSSQVTSLKSIFIKLQKEFFQPLRFFFCHFFCPLEFKGYIAWNIYLQII